MRYISHCYFLLSILSRAMKILSWSGPRQKASSYQFMVMMFFLHRQCHSAYIRNTLIWITSINSTAMKALTWSGSLQKIVSWLWFMAINCSLFTVNIIYHTVISVIFIISSARKAPSWAGCLEQIALILWFLGLYCFTVGTINHTLTTATISRIISTISSTLKVPGSWFASHPKIKPKLSIMGISLSLSLHYRSFIIHLQPIICHITVTSRPVYIPRLINKGRIVPKKGGLFMARGEEVPIGCFMARVHHQVLIFLFAVSFPLMVQ